MQYLDGEGGSAFFDISLTNLTAYYPWESDKNGKSGLTQALLGVSMVANTETEYSMSFLVPGTDTPYVVDESECHHAPQRARLIAARRPCPPHDSLPPNPPFAEP